MSFSNIALQQRERESKALRIFLACSFAGSLVFHLVLLASGVIQYLNRVPQIEEEPVEITLLDTPIEEIEPKEEEKPQPEPEKIEPKQEKPPEPEPLPEPEPNITQDTTTESQISGGSQAPPLFNPIPTQPRVVPQPPPVVEQPPLPKLDIPPIKPVSPPVVQQQPVIPEPEPDPILESKLSEEFKIPTTVPTQPPIPQPKPEPKFTTPPIEQPKPIPQPQLQARTSRELPIPTTPPVEQSSPIPELQTRTPRNLPIPTNPPLEKPSSIPQQDSQELVDSLKQSQENTNISSNNAAPSLPDTSNTTPTRRRRIIGGSNIATAPSTDSGIGNGTGDSVGDGDGGGDFRKCNVKYPNWAQRNRVEGKIIVAVDADTQGNVTNVRLIKGIGNDRLEKYHLKEVRRTCKFEPSSNGIQGKTISQTYQLR